MVAATEEEAGSVGALSRLGGDSISCLSRSLSLPGLQIIIMFRSANNKYVKVCK